MRLKRFHYMQHQFGAILSLQTVAAAAYLDFSNIEMFGYERHLCISFGYRSQAFLELFQRYRALIDILYDFVKTKTMMI
ncbi:hypothetical protein L9F63_015970, partial [Diploptera punctata]